MKQLPKYQYDADNGIIYKLEGDYYIPEVFTTIVEETLSLSLPGRTKLEFMKENEPWLYVELAEQDRLEEYLQNFSREMQEQIATIAHQMGGDANAEACAREIVYAQTFERSRNDGEEER